MNSLAAASPAPGLPGFRGGFTSAGVDAAGQRARDRAAQRRYGKARHPMIDRGQHFGCGIIPMLLCDRHGFSCANILSSKTPKRYELGTLGNLEGGLS